MVFQKKSVLVVFGFLFVLSTSLQSQSRDLLKERNDLKEKVLSNKSIKRSDFKALRIRLTSEILRYQAAQNYSTSLEDSLIYTTLLLEQIEEGIDRADIDSLKSAWNEFLKISGSSRSPEIHHSIQKLYEKENWKLQDMLKKYKIIFDFLDKIKVQVPFSIHHGKCALLFSLGSREFAQCWSQLASRSDLRDYQKQLLFISRLVQAYYQNLTDTELTLLEKQLTALLPLENRPPQYRAMIQLPIDELKLLISIAERKAKDSDISDFRLKYTEPKAEARLLTIYLLSKQNEAAAIKAFESIKAPAITDSEAPRYWALRFHVATALGQFDQAKRDLEQFDKIFSMPYPQSLMNQFAKIALSDLAKSKIDWNVIGAEAKEKKIRLETNQIEIKYVSMLVEAEALLAQLNQSPSPEHKALLVQKLKELADSLPETSGVRMTVLKLIERNEEKVIQKPKM